jgi:long-chain acyl-CoA synthetase
VEFRRELPKSLIGKVLRRVLVEEERRRQRLGSEARTESSAVTD